MHPKPLDPEFILTNSPLESIRYLEEVGSTNDVAKQLVQSDRSVSLPALVVADVQTHGRGRSGKTWWSEPGSLVLSLIVDSSSVQHPGLIACAVALGITKAIREQHRKLDAQIKWPNDVYVEARKVAGVLIETVSNQPNASTAIIGIGINLNCDLSMAPTELIGSAGSLMDLSGVASDPNDFLCRLISSITKYLDDMKSESTQCLNEYTNATLFLPGSKILVTLPNGNKVNGTYAGIGSIGQLLIDSEEQRIEVNSGTVDQFTFR